MIKVVEDIFKSGEDIPDDLDSYKINAIYHPPKDEISGYYVIDFETICQSLKIAVKRFVKACKTDSELSKKCSDIVHTDPNNKSDLSDWYEWFVSDNSFPMFKPIDTGGQQVMYEVNEYKDKYSSYYLSALLMEVDK